MKVYISTFLLLSFTPFVFAEGGVTPNCDHGILPDFKYHECLVKEIEQEEELLDFIYEDMMSNLSCNREQNTGLTICAQQSDKPLNIWQELLKKSQMDWRNYKSSNCRFFMETHYPGSMSNTVALECALHLTIERRKEIRRARSIGYGYN